MRTDDLIAHLSDAPPVVRRGAVARLLLTRLAPGLAGSALVMLVVLGPRDDMMPALAGFAMWMKLIYAAAIAAFAFWLVERAGRPGAHLTRPMALLGVPVLVLAMLAMLQMTAPGADAKSLMMGASANVCAACILMVAAPTLAAVLLALRQLAPTRLGVAGAAAGLFAGGAGAFVYAFHCPESAAPFVAVWYTLGIALTAAIGAILGRWALRW